MCAVKRIDGGVSAAPTTSVSRRSHTLTHDDQSNSPRLAWLCPDQTPFLNQKLPGGERALSHCSSRIYCDPMVVGNVLTDHMARLGTKNVSAVSEARPRRNARQHGALARFR